MSTVTGGLKPSDAVLSATADRDASQPLHTVSLTFKAPARPGPYHAICEIATDLKEEPAATLSTFATIAPYTIEEAYEVADAIARDDSAALRDELGDLLFQVVYHARMAEEAGRFDFAAVTRFGNSPFVVMAWKGLGTPTLEALIARLRAEPGRHNYGWGAVPANVASALFCGLAGLDVPAVGAQRRARGSGLSVSL